MATAEAVATASADAAATAAATAAALQAEPSAANQAIKTIESVSPQFSDMAAAQQVGTVAATNPVLTVRARGTLAGGVGPMMMLRVDGATIGTVEVKSTVLADYKFNLSNLRAGTKVDVVFTNDTVIAGANRDLFVAYIADAVQAVAPTAPGAIYDRGNGDKAFDGVDVIAGQGDMAWGGALRLVWPAAPTEAGTLTRQQDSARFLQQATFGPTKSTIDSLLAKPYNAWLDEQIAMPPTGDYVNHIQGKYKLGASYLPMGSNFTANWVGQKFWSTATKSPDQLRKRMAFALQQIFTVSQADSNLWWQARAYANYLDTLNKDAFGNFRTLLEDMALSPAMGIYLSHMRNRKEDLTTGRMPDENFAREIMQLFTIGLSELNADGSPKRDTAGNLIETYTNADVMAMAKVFTGWSWAYPDAQLTDTVFRWSTPNVTAAGDTGIDLLPMKPYPGEHSTAEKVLFRGKPWAVTIPANGSAATDLRMALDALFAHPNIGPFLGRQLIQRLVTSNPSPAYVGRVAAAFNNNGNGVRGDMAAVVRSILLDSEARNLSQIGTEKLVEPVLRVTQWLRAMDAKSSTGNFMMDWELTTSGERVLYAPSVFGYFRPGYVPPGTVLAAGGVTAPEFQLVNESSVAAWINTAEAMASSGLGWTGTAIDVVSDYSALVALANGGNLTAMVDHVNLVMLAGRMSSGLRQIIMDSIGSIGSSGSGSNLSRARAAVFLTLASPEYLVQK